MNIFLVMKRRMNMIRVEWIWYNVIDSKQIENDVIKKILSENPEIDLKNIKSIYVSFDRNEREKARRIWITNFEENEKKLELNDENYRFLIKFVNNII